MKRINRILLASALLVMGVSGQAQQSSPVDFMRMNPYQMKTNPATDLPYESVMSLVIGDFDMTLQNTSLRYDNLFEFDAQGRPATVNLRQFANSLNTNNFVGTEFGVDLFTLFRRVKNGMLNITYGVKGQTDTKFNDDLFKLLGYGNAVFVGENHPAVIKADANALAYQELAVGYQWKIGDNLSLGARGKLLFGAINFKTNAFDIKLYTDPDSYALRLQENVDVQASMPSAVYLDEFGNLKTNGPFIFRELFRNLGFGVDLAAEYRFDDRFSAVAAVRDLGFIHWGLNNIAMTGNINDAGQFYDNGDFLFNGLNVDQLQHIISDDSYRELFLDTLKQYFQVQFAPGESYNTPLNANLLLRGNYDLDVNNRFSAQMQGRFYGSGFRPAFTLAYNGYFFDKLDVCATYTVMPGSYDNIGLGIAGRFFKTCQVFVTTNNVIGLFNPMNTSGMNIRAGIVFVLRPEDKNTEYE